jgi:hypothetical protein
MSDGLVTMRPGTAEDLFIATVQAEETPVFAQQTAAFMRNPGRMKTEQQMLAFIFAFR